MKIDIKAGETHFRIYYSETTQRWLIERRGPQNDSKRTFTYLPSSPTLADAFARVAQML